MTVQVETHSARVTATDDPEQRGRIRVACIGLLGDDDSDLPMWVEPLPDWGWFYVPDVGELVDIEVVAASGTDEQFGQASLDSLDPKWKGARYYGNEEGEAPTPIHGQFTEANYGKRRGFATPGGHVLMFDDTEGDTRVVLTWAQEKDNRTDISQLSLEPDGTFKLVLGAGSGNALTIEGNGANTAGVFGDGAVNVAIANHLQTLYGSLKSYVENAIVQTSMGPSGTILAANGPAPEWDSAINSTQLKIPDNPGLSE